MCSVPTAVGVFEIKLNTTSTPIWRDRKHDKKSQAQLGGSHAIWAVSARARVRVRKSQLYETFVELTSFYLKKR